VTTSPAIVKLLTEEVTTSHKKLCSIKEEPSCTLPVAYLMFSNNIFRFFPSKKLMLFFCYVRTCRHAPEQKLTPLWEILNLQANWTHC